MKTPFYGNSNIILSCRFYTVFMGRVVLRFVGLTLFFLHLHKISNAFSLIGIKIFRVIPNIWNNTKELLIPFSALAFFVFGCPTKKQINREVLLCLATISFAYCVLKQKRQEKFLILVSLTLCTMFTRHRLFIFCYIFIFV